MTQGAVDRQSQYTLFELCVPCNPINHLGHYTDHRVGAVAVARGLAWRAWAGVAQAEGLRGPSMSHESESAVAPRAPACETVRPLAWP